MSGINAIPASRAGMKVTYEDPTEPERKIVRKGQGVTNSGMVTFSVQGDPGTTINIPKDMKLTRVDLSA
jgi:hypothetical protein